MCTRPPPLAVHHHPPAVNESLQTVLHGPEREDDLEEGGYPLSREARGVLAEDLFDPTQILFRNGAGHECVRVPRASGLRNSLDCLRFSPLLRKPAALCNCSSCVTLCCSIRSEPRPWARVEGTVDTERQPAQAGCKAAPGALGRRILMQRKRLRHHFCSILGCIAQLRSVGGLRNRAMPLACRQDCTRQLEERSKARALIPTRSADRPGNLGAPFYRTRCTSPQDGRHQAGNADECHGRGYRRMLHSCDAFETQRGRWPFTTDQSAIAAAPASHRFSPGMEPLPACQYQLEWPDPDRKASH